MATLRIGACILLGGLLVGQTSSTAAWEPVKFLLGSWEGTVQGQPGNGKSEREYKFVLTGKFLEVRNKSVYPAQPKNPKGETHEDWGMISYDRSRKQLVLRQFHVEGYVNQFVGTIRSDKSVQFDSESIENIPAGYRARETYTSLGPDEFVERFELADPGKEFVVYSETRFKRKN
jgi:hypothetical protein